MTVRIEFVFDFGSPNAYLAWRVLPQIAARTGAEIHFLPCLLGGIFKLTNNRSPINAFADIKGKLEYERLEIQRFISRHDLTAFRYNPYFPINTLQLMRSYVAAQRAGVSMVYLAAVQEAVWEAGAKMDDPGVIRSVLDTAGLDGATLIEAANDPSIKAELIANTETAVGRGVFGIPTFFVGDEMFFGKERLGQVEEAVRVAAGK